MDIKPKIALLISGLLRTFNDKLLPFLNQLPDNYDIYILTSKELTDFTNNHINIEELINQPKIKQIIIEDKISKFSSLLSKRDHNILNQLYKIRNQYNYIPKIYDIYVKCRPDINFKCNIKEFIEYIEQDINDNEILIPSDFDIYDTKLLEKISIENCVNDHIAIAKENTMKIYSSLYDIIDKTKSPIVSELCLKSHLINNNIKIKRIDLPYTICFSKCKTISICGDSGSGKSYLSRIINEILPFNQTLIFETDRYHKWERGNDNYKKYTHLNPDANHLEKLTNDAYSLSLGKDIFTVDYDHSNGKFTEPKKVETNNFIILCGLHTLYNNSLREISDIKIYLDTDLDLKMEWKIKRDVNERGANIDKVLDSIKNRDSDLVNFIEPQRKNADIIIKYKKNKENVKLIIGISKNNINNYKSIIEKMNIFTESINEDNIFSYLLIKNDIESTFLNDAVKEIKYIKNLKESYEGVIQYIILLLLWNF
jgi:uridine kinase